MARSQKEFRSGIRAILTAKGSFHRVARPLSAGHRDLLFPSVSECAPTNCRRKPWPHSALQKCGYCHGFNYHQRRLVSVHRRLLPGCERTERLSLAGSRRTKIVGWTDELPRMLHESHLLIGKAGGATVQETIAAGCPMIINHVVAGQEEGNARLIIETNSGVMALSPAEVVTQCQRA